jgi:hypothetical protein
VSLSGTGVGEPTNPRSRRFTKAPLRFTLDELKQLPRTDLRLEHFCVEGWSAVSVRTGVRLSELARRVDVSPDATCVDFESFDDDYHESWDIESGLHAQTLIVYGQDGQLLDPAFGAPARVYSPAKLGYKCTKYLRSPYSIVYRVRQEVIFIVAIAHHGRLPNDWRGRDEKGPP